MATVVSVAHSLPRRRWSAAARKHACVAVISGMKSDYLIWNRADRARHESASSAGAEEDPQGDP